MLTILRADVIGMSGEIFKMRFMASPIIAISHCTALRKHTSSQNVLNSLGRDEQNKSMFSTDLSISFNDLIICSSIYQMLSTVEFFAEIFVFDGRLIHQVDLSSE